MGNEASSAAGGSSSSGVYTGAPPPRKAKPLYKDMEEAWKLIGACCLVGLIDWVSDDRRGGALGGGPID